MMTLASRPWPKNALRLLLWAALVGVLWAGGASAASADGVSGFVEEAAAPEAPADFWGFLAQVGANLFNSRALMATLSQPRFTVAALVVLNAIVFIETGLLVGFFLPGDSLLVTAGLICASPHCDWSLPLLLGSLCLSAVVGDSVGYAIGLKTGPKIFTREKSLLFNKDHLLKAQAFYEKHGGKTIILARFMPILRTFAPVVAGVGKMEYRRFLAYNVVGGVGWVVSMVLFGYWLPAVLNVPMQRLLGSEFRVEDHVEKVVVLVVLASVAPIGIAWLRSKFAPAPDAAAACAAAAKKAA